MAARIEVLLCYAQEDYKEMKELAIHLGVLKRQGFVDVWHDQNVCAGSEWMQEMENHLGEARIIVLLISQYFMNSDYCYGIQMVQAIERHKRGEACVIPVLLRPVYYSRAPFAKLQCLPMGGKPIISWNNLDEALFDVAEGIRRAAEQFLGC